MTREEFMCWRIWDALGYPDMTPEEAYKILKAKGFDASWDGEDFYVRIKNYKFYIDFDGCQDSIEIIYI
ncbi:hypothetical protein [Oceanotoga phage vB_OteS-UFV02]